MDCLACMCKAKALMDPLGMTSSAPAAMNGPGLIEVIGDGDDAYGGDKSSPTGERRDYVKGADPLTLVLDLFCGNIGLAETLSDDFQCDAAATSLGDLEVTPMAFRICMANILISLIRMWQPTSGDHSGNAGSVLTGGGSGGGSGYVTRQNSIVSIVKDLSSFSDQKQVDSVLRGAALQVMFIAVHQLQGDVADSGIPFGRVHAVAIAASQDATSPELRMAGLKLLAILIGKVKGIFAKVLAGAAGHTKTVLSQIANIDASEQVRELAEKILASAFV